MNGFSLASSRVLDEVLYKKEEWETAFSVVSSLQNEGILSEKSKDVDSAVGFYERCVFYGEASTLLRINDYMYSIERLAVLYRKQKRFSDEIRVVSLGLSHRHDANVYDSPFARLEKRLAKAIMLNEKSKL
jgi:hypothetical protein